MADIRPRLAARFPGTFISAGSQFIGTTFETTSGNIIFNDGAAPRKPKAILPLRRDPDFVERNVLQEIARKCGEPAARIALVGLGGIGKTQLALEYCFRRKEESSDTWIFWVHASSVARFEEGYRNIALQVGLVPRAQDETNTLRLVQRYLSDANWGEWVMVINNYDKQFAPEHGGSGSSSSSAEGLAHFLPVSAEGVILLTSRDREIARYVVDHERDIIGVEPMSPEEGVQMVEAKLQQSSIQKEDALRLVVELDCIPLAIAQAVA